MIYAFSFSIVVTLLGILTFPITFLLFKSLPDRGYTFSKIISVLLVSYVFWMLGVFHVLPNTLTGACIAAALVFCLSGFLFFRQKQAILTFFTKEYRYIAFVEGLFFLFFAGATLLRATVPEIAGTEKPFELMLLNSIHNSHFFPPYDAWYGGQPMSYYYFGYIILHTISLLSRTATSIAFNLGISLTWALAVLATWGFSYNLLVRATKKLFLFSFLPVILLLLIGNFEGIIELLAAHGIGSDAFYRGVGIDGLSHAYHSAQWFPDQFWFFWRATRITTNWNVMEFPFFSFLLGDLHPHLLVLPYVIVFFGYLIVLVKTRLTGLTVFTTGFFLGAVAAINTWFFPVMGVLTGLIIFFSSDMSLRKKYVLVQNTVKTAGIGILSVILFLPLFLTAHTSLGGLQLVTVLFKAGFVPKDAIVSSPLQVFLFWGPLMLLSLFAFFPKPHVFKIRWYTVFLTLLPVLFWLGAFIDLHGFWALAKELSARGLSLFSLAVLFVFLLLSLQRLFAAKKDDPPAVLSSSFLFLGFFLTFFSELFYLQDVMQSRYNTVFKLYFNAWILLSMGIGIPLAQQFLKSQIGLLNKGIILFVILLASVYSVTALFNRIDTSQHLSLDGIAYLQKSQTDDFAAIQWLQTHAQPDEVIVEASGADYSQDNLISAMTGLPTVIGWIGTHELQIHGNAADIEKRRMAVEALYKTADEKIAKDIIQQYHIVFIVLSPLEITKYGATGTEKYKTYPAVFQQGSVTLYKTQ